MPDEIEAVAFADFPAAPPPNVSDGTVGIAAGDGALDAAADAAVDDSVERQRDADDAVGARRSGEAAAAGRRRQRRRRRGAERHRGIAAEDEQLFAEHAGFEPDLGADRFDVVKTHAGILRLEIDRGFDADALVGGDVILGRHRLHAAAIAAGDADAQPRGVDAGHRAPVGLDAALAGHARDFVAQRRQQRIEEFGAESRDRNRSAPTSAKSIPKTCCSCRADRRAADWRAPSRSPEGSRRRWRARRCSPARCAAWWIWQACAADWADTWCWSCLVGW